MHPQSERLTVHLHRFAVPCSRHGQHVYYLAGLDHAADDAALYLLRALRRNKHKPEYGGTQIDLETLKSVLFTLEDYDDDISF